MTENSNTDLTGYRFNEEGEDRVPALLGGLPGIVLDAAIADSGKVVSKVSGAKYEIIFGFNNYFVQWIFLSSATLRGKIFATG